MVKATAADGKTPLHSVIGEGIFVSAVEFNKLYAANVGLEQRLIDWRNLALQFDSHRMQALWWLRSIKKGTATVADIEDFLKSAPKEGDAIVKEYLDEVAKQQGSVK